MTHAGYLRFPHVQGDLLTFVADDDVWLAPADGGRAWRISSDHAPVSFPRLSPDGTLLAWTSRCDGAPEIRLCEVEGGDARRLTYWGDGATRVVGWAPGDGILALTAAGQPFERMLWAHLLALPGGLPRRLPFGPVADLALAGGQTALLSGTWGRDPAYWKRYRGGTAGRLWTRDTDSEPFRRVLADVPGQFSCPMLVAGRLVFLSDHEGTGNLYSCQPDGSDLRRHTDHDGFYARQASTDGQRVVYQRCGEIWLLESLDAQPRRVAAVLAGSSSSVAPRLVSADEHLGDLSCDETGKASVIEVQGTVHWLTHKDGPARALAVTRDARARLPQVLGTSGQAVWVTDAGGADALEVAPVTGPADGQRPRRIAAGELGIVTALAAAPDGKTVAAASRDGRLHVVEIATGQARTLAASEDGPVTGLAFSPDSAWLAWSQPEHRPLSRIRLARLADPAVVDVTDGRFTDTEPVFSLDGRYLAFLSRRSFDPVYDAHSFDLSFPSGCRPYLVTLAAATPSPFGPLADGRPVADDPPGDSHRAGGEGGGADGADDDQTSAPPAGEGERPGSVPPIRVDAGGLPQRVVGLPVEESLYWSLYPVTGGFVWLKRPVTGVLGEGGSDPDGDPPRPALERFDLRMRSCTELAGELDWFAVSGDGNRLVIRDSSELRVVSSRRKEGGDGPPPVRVDLSRARFLADPVAQWRHAFEEAGRAIRHDFWVPDMADVDWDGVLDGYRPLVGAIRTADEFTDLLWEVLGELGTSHAYARSAYSGQDSPPAGYLGADLEQAGDGSWRIGRVLPGESSDPQARSPLAGPGVGEVEGATILAVDGQPVEPATGPAPLLVGAAGKPVELTVATGDSQPRRVAVVPLRSERRLRYQDWVASNRHRVREASGGSAGYLHVPDMLGQGWAQFHRDLRAEIARDLLILDLRNNRGGHVSELVVEKLTRRVIGWDLPRGMRPETYPHDAPRGPVVALTDEFAGSDGDVITAALRILRLGPVIGARTWGGVIGIEDPVELVDGTQITVPRYALWLEGHGWGVENYGVEPDVEVLITPGDWAQGRDTQLATAVRLGLEALAAHPAQRPPQTAGRPSRRRPLLPPRTVGQPAS